MKDYLHDINVKIDNAQHECQVTSYMCELQCLFEVVRASQTFMINTLSDDAKDALWVLQAETMDSIDEAIDNAKAQIGILRDVEEFGDYETQVRQTLTDSNMGVL